MKHSIVSNSYKSRRAKYIGLLVSLFAVVLLAACSQNTSTPSLSETNRVTYDLSGKDAAALGTLGVTEGNGITVTFEKTADWDLGGGNRGFTANITLLNETGASLDDWDLNFKFPYSIDQVWNAQLSTTNTSFKVLPANWNRTLDDGQSRSFGFNGSYSDYFQEPYAYILSGIPIGDQAAPEPVVRVCSLDTRFQVNSSWQNANGSQGFVAELYMTNIGSEPINWELDFDFNASISSMWNADFTQDGNSYRVSPADWNVRIEPGQTRNFGFQGVYTGTLGEPENIVCNAGDPDFEPVSPPDVWVESFIGLTEQANAQPGVSGTAISSNGELLSNVDLTLTFSKTGNVYSGTSDANGQFAFTDISEVGPFILEGAKADMVGSLSFSTLETSPQATAALVLTEQGPGSVLGFVSQDGSSAPNTIVTLAFMETPYTTSVITRVGPSS